MDTNTNLATSGNIIKTEDFSGKLIKMIFLLLVVVFPWVVLPGSEKPLEASRETLIFIVIGFLWIMMFFRAFARKEIEWRKTKLGWIFLVLAGFLGILFFYSPDYYSAWRGYAGSLTGGLSEYLAFLATYFLAVQIFNLAEWKKIIALFAVSTTLVLIFYMAAAIYYENNAILTVNFARTPTLVASATGLLSLAMWWTVKRTEMAKKARGFFLLIVLFFITSLLDFHIGWLMWVAGTAILLIFDIVSRFQSYLREKEEVQLGFGRGKRGLAAVIFQGDAKYLSIVLFFSLSRALSPLFLGKEKLTLLPFFSFLKQYPLLGQKVFLYLGINFLIFCFGLYYYLRTKKDRAEILLVLSSLAAVMTAHVFYYSESTILFFLNWLLIVYSGLTFLRAVPEKDYLYLIRDGSAGKKAFVIVSVIVGIVIIALFTTFYF